MSLFRLIKFFTVSILVLILSGCQNNSINDEINAAKIDTSTDLPATVYVGKSYPVVFTVTNSSLSDNYTGATITSDVTGSGTFTEDTSSYANKCTTTLTAASTCVLKGTFVAADTAAGQLIKATYSYDQGNDVESSTTAVTPVAAVTAAKIDTSTDLPATVYVGKSYPVVFTVTNSSLSDNYTGATITSDVTGSGTFTEDTSSYANKCTTTLTAASTCVLKGTFVAADTAAGQLIKATYSYDQGNDVESSTTAVTPVAAVTAAKIDTSTDLPATVYVGKSYPVVFTVTNSSLSDNYTGATITSDVTGSGTFTEDTSSYANKCTTTLTAASTCVLKGTFVAADTAAGQLIKATYSYDQGNDVESSTTAVTPVAAVTAAKIDTSTDLPATVYVGKSYPVVFTVTNSSLSDNYTGATITSDVTGSGTFTEDTSSYANKCTTTLTAASTCVLKGTFVAADTAAGQLIKATYSYDQGNDVESSTTAVTPVAAVTAAKIDTSTDLPATVYVGKSYPVVFTVTNSSLSDNYTGATITSDVTGSGTFTEDTSSYANKCTTTLTAASTCVLKGTFVAADTAAGQLIKATYSYDQGNDVESSTTAVTPVAAVTAAKIDTSTDLPATVYVGKSYPVVFTVTNSSLSDNYTGATITSDVTGSGTFTEDTSSYANKCTTTLTAASTCVLKGTFVAADTAAGQLIKATYSYDQGNDVESSTTAVTPVAAVTAAKIDTSTDLPATVYVGKSYPVVFTVTNSSLSDNYTGATITSDVTGSGTFTEDTSSYANKCTTTLTAASTCVLKGTFVAADTAAGQLIKATYSYDQGNDVESSTTAVTPVAAVTAAKIDTSTDLPATVYVGKSYPVVFTVTNSSLSDNYTGATITSDVTGSGTFTEDTSSYANKCTTTLTAASTCVLKGTFVAADTAAGQLIKATYSYDQGNDVESSTTAVTPVAAVTAAKIDTSTDLPATVYVGKSYPVVFTVTNSSLSDNYTGATITSDVTGSGTFTEDTSSYANKCTTTLTAASTCVLKGTFVAADTAAGQLIKATYSYDQGNDVESSTTAVTPVAAVTAAKIDTSTDLPATVYVGKSYPVVFTVTNSSLSDNYTGATITSDVTGSGTFTEDTSSYANKCTTTLTAASTCVLKGTFVAADTAAGQLIKATYSYDQGNDVESSTTAVTPVAAVTAAKIDTSTDLPATVYVGKSYPVVFTVTNSSLSDNYTGATITSDVTGSGTFTEDTSSYANKCTTTLTAASTCVLKGTFVAADTAAGQLIKATYSYDQGNDVESSTTAVTPVAAVTAAKIDTSTDLPATVYVGKSYPVVFTVTNSSLSDNYTGATITSDVTGSGTFTEDTSSYANKCTTTLTAGSTCVLKGTFVAADTAAGQLIKATYSYDQGNDVESSTTAVTPVALYPDIFATYGVKTGDTLPVTFTVTNNTAFVMNNASFKVLNLDYDVQWTPDTSSYSDKCTSTLQSGSSCVVKGSITGKVNQSVLFQYTHDGLVLNKGFFEGMPNLWVVHNDKSVEHIEAGHNQTVDLTILNGFTTGTKMDMYLGSGLTILSNNCGTSLISASHTCDIKIQVSNSNANQSELIFSQNVGYNGAQLPVRELDLSINPSTYYINFTGTGNRQVQFTNNTAQDLNLSSTNQAYIGTPSSIDLSDCTGKTIAPGNTCNITIHDAYTDGDNSYYGNYELLNGSNVVAKVDISSGKEGSSFICTSKTTSLALSNPLILSTGYGGYTLPILGSGSSGINKITQTLDQCAFNFRLIQYDYNKPKPGNIFYNGYLRLRDYNLAAVSDTSLQKTVYEFDTLPLQGLKIAWNDTSSAYDVLTFGSKDYRCLYNYSVGFPSWNFFGYQPSKSDPPGMRYLICNTPVLNSFQYVNIDNIVKII